MPSFRVDEPSGASVPAGGELHTSASLTSSLSKLHVEAEEFVPAVSSSGAFPAVDVADGLEPVRHGHVHESPSCVSPEDQAPKPVHWEERVDLKIKAYLLENSAEYRQLTELRNLVSRLLHLILMDGGTTPLTYTGVEQSGRRHLLQETAPGG